MSAFRPSLCSVVFSALVETNASLQVTATSVLTLLGRQTGESRPGPPAVGVGFGLSLRRDARVRALSLRFAAGLRHPAGGGSPDQAAAGGGGRRRQVCLAGRRRLREGTVHPAPPCRSPNSLAVLACVGALAELHPDTFISKLIPRLKTEIFSGRKRKKDEH